MMDVEGGSVDGESRGWAVVRGIVAFFGVYDGSCRAVILPLNSFRSASALIGCVRVRPLRLGFVDQDYNLAVRSSQVAQSMES